MRCYQIPKIIVFSNQLHLNQVGRQVKPNHRLLWVVVHIGYFFISFTYDAQLNVQKIH